MNDESGPTFTADQAAGANTALRAALGLPPQRFPLSALVGMLSDEIEQLRDAGKADEEIAALLSQAIGATVDAETIARHYASPEERGRPG